MCSFGWRWWAVNRLKTRACLRRRISVQQRQSLAACAKAPWMRPGAGGSTRHDRSMGRTTSGCQKFTQSDAFASTCVRLLMRGTPVPSAERVLFHQEAARNSSEPMRSIKVVKPGCSWCSRQCSLARNQRWLTVLSSHAAIFSPEIPFFPAPTPDARCAMDIF